MRTCLYDQDRHESRAAIFEGLESWNSTRELGILTEFRDLVGTINFSHIISHQFQLYNTVRNKSQDHNILSEQ